MLHSRALKSLGLTSHIDDTYSQLLLEVAVRGSHRQLRPVLAAGATGPPPQPDGDSAAQAAELQQLIARVATVVEQGPARRARHKETMKLWDDQASTFEPTSTTSMHLRS